MYICMAFIELFNYLHDIALIKLNQKYWELNGCQVHSYMYYLIQASQQLFYKKVLLYFPCYVVTLILQKR